MTELRSLLDDAGVALALAGSDSDLALMMLKDDVEANEPIVRVQKHVDAMFQAGPKIAIRLGPEHAVMASLREGTNSLQVAREALWAANAAIRRGGSPEFTHAEEHLEVVRRARDAYYESTEKLIGPLQEAGGS